MSAGTFDSKTLDGKNWLWIKYEAGLIRSLLLQEGDLLETRFDRFPANLHKDLLHSLGLAWKPEGAFEPGLPAGEDREATLRKIHDNWPKDQVAARDAFAKEHGIK